MIIARGDAGLDVLQLRDDSDEHLIYSNRNVKVSSLRAGLGQQVPSGFQGPPTVSPTQGSFVTQIGHWASSRPICIPKRRHGEGG